MNASTLGLLVRSKMLAKGLRDDPQTGLTAEAIAEAVIEHIQATATIVGVVTACPAGAGTGTGAPGSIT
jgi:hypothetical protein